MQTKTGAALTASPEKNRKVGRVLVLGLGNILLKDEGVGVHMARLPSRCASTPILTSVALRAAASFDVSSESIAQA